MRKIYSIIVSLFLMGQVLQGQTNFDYTGSLQTYTVPSGVTSIIIETWGAQGGDILDYYPITGGLGGYSKGSLTVTPGQILNIFVGGKGENRLGNHPYPGCTYVPGGWNGGGGTRTAGTGTPGGGATDIRIGGTALGNRIIVAGGGGGGGWTYAKGGAGGGLIGQNGTNMNQSGTGAYGGSQSAGGAMGSGGGGCGKTAGMLGQGGDGSGSSAGGGGGGGGYYGGGGGGYSDGGGGGSSYIGGVVNGSTTQGVQSGNGYVRITPTNVFNYNGSMQTYTVPQGVISINIEAAGAQGGASYWANGGLGAYINGSISVTPGDVLKILVGQQGGIGNQGGGGGGTFVTTSSNSPLVIAGGGGGGYYYNYSFNASNANGTTGNSGMPGIYGAGNTNGGAGGTNGNGGSCAPQFLGSPQGAGGGGFLGDGSTCSSTTGGKSFINGGAGGTPAGPGGYGGYGGGGAGDWSYWTGAGGGGGYSGGGGGTYYGGGGGGGSYNVGTSQSNISGVQSGNGYVRITPTTISSSPVITSVNTNKSDGYYRVGEVIDFLVNFDYPMQVTGTPKILLNTIPGSYANYDSGSGTNELVFKYTVTAAENSIDLDYSSANSLNLNGGSILYLGNFAPNTTLPAVGTFAGEHNIVIDNIKPQPSIASKTANLTGSYPIPITIDFAEVVTGFELSDLTLVNCTAGNLVELESGALYKIDITPVSSGPISVEVPASISQDLAGNSNLLSSLFTRTFDGIKPTASFYSTSVSPTNDNPVVVNVLFSEEITGFSLSDLVIVNGSPTNLITIKDGKQYTVDILPTKVGAVTIDLPLNKVLDAAGNGNISATQFSITCNNISPTVNLSSSSTDPTNINPIVATVLFSEVVTGFELADLDLSNGTAGNLKTIVAGKQFTVDITPAGEGLIIVNIPANCAKNTTGNGNTSAAPLNINYDKTVPKATLSTLTESPVNSSNIGITIDFNEPVTGFDLTDVLVGNGTASNLVSVIAGVKYTAVITPTADGTVTVNLASNKVSDLAGNANIAATQLSIVSDKTAPTVSISSTASNLTSDNPIVLTISFNEPVTGFQISDLTIGNGSAIKFAESVGGTQFIVHIKPDVDGTVTVDVAAGKVTDLAGNGNNAATQFSIAFDQTTPTASISSALSNPTNDNSMSINIDFSETVTGFDLTDIVVTNGTASNLVATTLGKQFTVDVTPAADGEVAVYIIDNAAFDNSGNGNKASLFTIVFDGTIPSVLMYSAAQSVTSSNPIALIIKFSEFVSGLELADITVANGVASTLVEEVSGKQYTVNINPSAEGDVTVDIAPGKASDVAGNGNSAALQFKTKYDATAPQATISTTATSPTNAAFINVSIKFNEAVVGFGLDYVYTTNGQSENFVEVVPGLEYTLTVRPVSDGDVTVSIVGGVIHDAAGNGNIASSIIVIAFDRTAADLMGITLNGVTINTASFSVSTSEDCKVYYQVLLKQTTAPTAQEIIANTGDSVVIAGNLNIQTDVENEISLVNLEMDETYTLYMLTEDALKNHSTVYNADFATSFVEIAQNEHLNIELYPNPNKGEFFIDLKDSDIIGARIIVRDISGRLIEDLYLKERKQKIDLQHQPQGVYVVQVHLTTGIYTYKFLIE